MEEKYQQMFKSKVCGSVQEVIFPEFPDDDNTVTTTVTKSRRVSFGTNFIKEFIVGSAVSATCVSEYEQAFSSSDSSNPNSSHSVAESDSIDHDPPFLPENSKIHSTGPPIFKPPDLDSSEHPKPTKFSRTICFSADSPTADMEFTEGCITLARSILDKKNKEMTVIIQAKSKEPKEEDRPKKEDVTILFDGSQLEMSETRCLKSKENKREDRRFESDKTKIFNKFDDEMSITRCDKVFKMKQSKLPDDSDFMTEDSKENRVPLDLIMRQLDRNDSDSDLFNPEKSFSDVLNAESFDLTNESEKLNLNESMDISKDFHQTENQTPQERVSFNEKTNENVLVGLSISDEFEAQIFKCQAEEEEEEEEEEEKKEEEKEVQETPADSTDLDHNISMEIENQENLNKRNITNLLQTEQTSMEESFVESVQNQSEPLLVDVKVIENLEEQSKESNCVWTIQEVRYPESKTLGLLSFNCTLLRTPTVVQFTLKKSKGDSMDSCSVITESSIRLQEETTPIHPEYNLVLGFGFKKQEEYFNERKQKISSIRHIPYFLDEINSFMRKINSYLGQVYEILISYPGSSLKDAILSFRLFSYPIFFSSTVFVDLTHLFTLSESSLSFKHDIGHMDEKSIGNIFQDCLKHKNCLCEFIIRSSKYLFDIERGTGFVSRRSHIRLLPAELRL